MSPFQFIVTAIFVVFIVVGVAVFALFGGLVGGSSVGLVNIWGIEDQDKIDGVLNIIKQQDKSFEDVHYTQKKADTYINDVINAIASGTGPDLFFVTQEELGLMQDKITPIPFGSFSQGAFTSSFIDEGYLFLTPSGSLALPFIVDPLVMYWNRDLFAGAGVAVPPTQWTDLFTLAPKITSLDASANIRKSTIAMGEWTNVVHAKRILSAILIQGGDKIVTRAADGSLLPVFGVPPEGATENPTESIVRFYTEFANPSKTTYSWNRALPKSTDAFAAGSVAIYLGLASEYRALVERNPNLHFSVAPVPQIANGNKATYGVMTGVAIARGARNPGGALQIAAKMTSQKSIGQVVSATGLPPVRRDVNVDTSGNAVGATFVQSALISSGWVDPDRAATDAIFKRMIESVISGRLEPLGAVAQAQQEFDSLLRK
jgi:ABC-type glycerol-3-phosphate transport system substrate-binding protein